MTLNRPRLGGIARESGQKDEESKRNPKKAPTPRARKWRSGGLFRTFRHLEGLDIFQSFPGRQADVVQDPFRPHVFVQFLRVSLFRPLTVSYIVYTVQLLVKKSFGKKSDTRDPFSASMDSRMPP